MKTMKPHQFKTLCGLALMGLLALFFSCTQESVNSDLNEADNLNLQAAKASQAKKVTKKISGRLVNFPDPNELPEETLICFPQEFQFPLTRNTISGHMTHLGSLQEGISDPVTGERLSGSFGVPISCEINLETFNQLFTVYKVFYVAANGDYFETTEQVTINFPNTFVDEDGVTQIDYTTGNFGGSAGFEHAITIDGGTGRFAGASGHMDFVDATFGPDGSFWELVGEITY
ncbi:hypothetical protein ACT6NV_06750 [Robiginitalea sp. IMCC44478]|uniref:hypothetical protein n=1 Tax=Robiginitalea sp. IMCC44478 TaxID=3459122 RepID=UPI0040423E5B